MKIFRILMLAFLGLAGYVGAVKSASANRQSGTLYHKIGANNYEVILPSEQGDAPGQWNCEDPDLSVTCTYHRSNGAPISDANAVRATTGNFVQN